MLVLTQKEIEEIAYDLQGTCKSIDQAICDVVDQRHTSERIYDLSEVSNWKELCAHVDNVVFECACCGWWCETGDYAEVQDNPNGDVCSDCGPDEEEGEED